MQKNTYSAAETRAFAQTLAKKSHGGDIYGLIGDLGSGKTTFVQGFADGLGISQDVVSPTFIFMKVYRVPGPKKTKHLCHVDAYRMPDHDEMLELSLLERLERNDTITIIEWADRTPSLLQRFSYTTIRFQLVTETQRHLVVRSQRPSAKKG